MYSGFLPEEGGGGGGRGGGVPLTSLEHPLTLLAASKFGKDSENDGNERLLSFPP